jgi:hypothetical protein
MKQNSLTEKQKSIVEMWEKGMSSTEIADLLRITRNSVMGIVFRLQKKGLIMRVDNPAKKKGYLSKPQKNPRPPAPPRLPPKPKVDDPTAQKRQEEAEKLREFFQRRDADRGVTIFDLKYDSCRFIAGEVMADKTIYCGKPVSRRHYCAEHAALCYFKRQSASNADNAPTQPAITRFNAKRPGAGAHYY